MIHQSTFLGVLIILALFMFMLIIRSESFALPEGGYGEYLSRLKNTGEPYGRVYSRESYNIIRNSDDPASMISKLREWP